MIALIPKYQVSSKHKCNYKAVGENIEVLAPILSNPNNYKGWPRIVLEDVRKHVENLKGKVYVLSGLIAGTTTLPLPTYTEPLPQNQIWEEELKSNSMKLMDILIENAERKVSKLQADIEILENEIMELNLKEATEKNFVILNDVILRFQDEIKQRKARKFKRDEMDYANDVDLLRRWEEELKSNSMKLMDILIENAERKVSKLQADIEILENEIMELNLKEATEKNFVILNDVILRFQDEIKQRKARKFKRDEMDYANDIHDTVALMTITDYEENPTTVSTVLQDLNVASDIHITSGLKQRSTWTPRSALDNSIDTFYKMVWTDLNRQDMKGIHLNKPNLNKEEYKALQSLRSDDTVIIKKADKGGNIVVLNRKDYEQEVYTQLLDENCYEKDIGKGFSISEKNQAEIREACEALERKLDLLSLRTQALEDTVGTMKEEIEVHKVDIQAFKDSEQALQSKLEQLENSSRRKNMRVLHVPEGAEGDDLKAFSVSLLKSVPSLEESEEEIARDIPRIHRDPFRKNPNNSKPRKILINFLTCGLKEKILSKALKLRTIKAQDFSFEIKLDLSRITINRQWELGQRLEEFRLLGASAQLKFPATLKVMFNNKMHNVRDEKAADEQLAAFNSGGSATGKAHFGERVALYSFETMVIQWTHQISDVLRRDSAQMILQGEHPGPSVELDFWLMQRDNLLSIYNQLKNAEIQKVIAILKRSESSYYPGFRELILNVKEALSEAQDIELYLRLLKFYIAYMEESNFPEIERLIAPLYHTICLIWMHCRYYCSPARIVVLLQEFCNLLIDRAFAYIIPEELFKMDLEEGMEKVQQTIKVFTSFKKTFSTCKEKIAVNWKTMKEVKLWEFPSHLIFSRFDKIHERLINIEELFTSAIDFTKLERIAIGGMRGKILSEEIHIMNEEFQEIWRVFQESKYDPLDYRNMEFLHDYKRYTQQMNAFDHHLANILNVAFNESNGLDSAFKVLQIFGSLLERPIINSLFYPNYAVLLSMFEKEINCCKKIYHNQKQEKKSGGCDVLHKNMPFTAGNLKWSQELRDRILGQRTSFKHVNHQALQTDEASLVFQKCDELLQLLDKHDNEIYTAWANNLNFLCESHLNQPILRGDEHGFFEVNFNHQLLAVLREVKYLEMLKHTEIPEVAMVLYSKREMLHKHIGNLNLISKAYNRLKITLLQVEEKLIEQELQSIHVQLLPALDTLTWQNEDLWDYIQETQNIVYNLDIRVQKAKCNVETIQRLMSSLSEVSFFIRKHGRNSSLLCFDDQEKMSKQYLMVQETSDKISQLVQDNQQLFQADSLSDNWKTYSEYIDHIILDGLFRAIKCSLQYVIDNTEKTFKYAPLFEIQLVLNGNEMTFRPLLDLNMNGNFADIVEGILGDIYRVASYIKRVAKHQGKDNYQEDVDVMAKLEEMHQEIMNRVHKVIVDIKRYQRSFNKYSYLWTDDRYEFMNQFLLYGRFLTAEELELYADYELQKCSPQLENFKEQINVYESLYNEVSALENQKVFNGWIQVDIKPFKVSLKNVIKKWSWMFQEHLLRHVTHSVCELEEFIRETEKGLAKKVKSGDYAVLLEIMGHLMAMRDRQSTEDNFKPLKSTAELLRTYKQRLPEEIYSQLEELPEKWKNLKKIAFAVKHEVAPLQANEVSVIRRKCVLFEVKQHEFRNRFKNDIIFRFDAEDPYEHMDKTHKNILKYEAEMKKLQQTAELFEVTVSEYKQLKQCRSDIILLKSVWDMVIFVRTSIKDWMKTPWTQVNVEQMDMELRRFAKEMKTIDKEIRTWDVYIGLESTVKNLLISLRAVNELQNPAVRNRHWHQLMNTTGVRFVMNEETILGDLLALNLHRVEDEVKNIVDKAVKEMAIEKVLVEIKYTWSIMEFSYEKHHTTGTPLLKSDENLIENLEDNQVQLQNILMSKYVEYFLVEVRSWQKKLMIADMVISIWLEVQQTWAHLQSIFTNSEDIRKQLPEDAKRFEIIDLDFKELVIGVVTARKVIEVTNQMGLLENLEVLQNRLTLCEKSLADYLEGKRLTFPRFYFVSAVDLLEIISKGTQPQQVTRHLLKLFDNVADLKFEDDELKAQYAVGMYSREEEFVYFSDPCFCEGQAEGWLRHLEEAMHSAVRREIMEAISAYEDKPRDQWLFDYSAQAALTGSQIWWVADVGIAFERLEEGFETALKDYNRKQIAQLNALINMLLGELTPGDRQKIMTICTIDVHARDVVAKLIAQKVSTGQAFSWISQLRHRWDDIQKDCFVNICDAQFQYSYEYLGNTPRLVITPLTDRCYITLTQSLHLTMSGALSGPAGTGKTETTKDLGRSLGIMVYVFNCSEQMDYKSIGNIYKGLCQTGVWGCFDEFNRISVEVLSVVAVQVKTIQDAIRHKKKRFYFLGETIELKTTIGIFITLNPGYAGRAELPENVKALFRPCAMVIPDFELICEIMLVAEGFVDARLLARKFISLYTLCRELLSKQDHYDWGLRAIKSVLVVAGSLKREDRSRPEDQVLMRALRDFNLPKIVTNDVSIFLGLINDLFPLLEVPRKKDLKMEQMVRQSIAELRLQPEETFILKVTQLEELLAVRHSVFVVGNAGTGKSKILKTLHRTYAKIKLRALWNDINPKAVTTDELFGFLHPSTREWKDGLFSSMMRELSAISHDGPKWIVLDGDIDPMWIESLNTVMDDNKVLTLASNERISLTPSMRLLFEISHLRAATPATVSRAGILYVNTQDLGWSPYVTSWIETRKAQSERANLTILFDKYVPYCLEQVRCNLKTITPIPENSMVQTLCSLLDCLLTEENTPPDSPRELYEIYFVFASVWSFGGALFQDQLIDYRMEFSRWWTKEMRTIKFPSQGTVFDYFIDPETNKFTPWSEKIPDFEMEPDVPLQTILVHTAETVRLRYFVDLLLEKGKLIMLVGNAGVGKTILVSDKLSRLSEDYMVAKVPFNYYTTSAMLQRVLEKPLEKKAGRNYAPPGTKKLIYFIDDLNMPEVDAYSTVQPHTLIRQHLDYSHWYDRQKLIVKEIHNCQYITCMNPTAGSFSINPRLQRHFSVFAVHFPGMDSLTTIYSKILNAHLQYGGFSFSVVKSSSTTIQAAICLHQKMTQNFLPTAIRFHYVFNLRDLTHIFQGLLFASLECVQLPIDLVYLWLHESSRVYADKLMDEKDIEHFNKVLIDTAKRFFEGVDERLFSDKPLMYSHFAHGVGEPRYFPVSDWEKLTRILTDALEHYNEIHAAMNLVLFQDAIQHICRISRILEFPYGNALLIGVGGSGKQSLCRLAAFLSSLEVFQISLRKGYAIHDLRSDIATLYFKVGVKNIGTVFLHTDAQIPDERFLVLINDMLASGEIPDLFSEEEVDSIISSTKMELRGLGLADSRDNCWQFFIDRIRRQLKVVLCFSPVGFTLRARARKFPALVNCTAIDWFHAWPQVALQSVSSSFIEKMDGLDPQVKSSVSQFIAFAHSSVNEVSVKYQQNEKHYNYTTPKSFLEMIKLYQNLLSKKRKELVQKMERLENGLQKLQTTASQVEDLKSKLATQEVELHQRTKDTEALIAKIGQQTEKLNQEKSVADAEEQRVAAIQEEVTKQQQESESDLAKAEPALMAANAALNTLNRLNLTELKTFPNPPAAVTNVTAAVLVLLSPNGKIPKDRSWKVAKTSLMGQVDDFLQSLVNFDKEHIPEATVKAVKETYLRDPEFSPEFVRTKSSAAAGLCAWVTNIIRFHEVYCEVDLKRQSLSQANTDLGIAAEKLQLIRKKLDELDTSLAALTTGFERATAEKIRCQEEVNRTNKTIELANRLVKGLESENIRWAHSVAQYHEQEETLCGDVLLTSAFISYAGSFSKKYRHELVDSLWMPYLRSQKVLIPMTEGLDPISMLTDDATIAKWNNEGLPSDNMSTQNGTILTNCERWPLLIDPQLQGIKWIKSRYGSNLKVIHLGQRGYVDIIEQAVVVGDPVLIENLEETIDPILDPLLGRHTLKKGRYIRVGDKECKFHHKFRLILHTKLANPHYKPEIQAQTTLINFTVTRDGLEDQLLADVVNLERPDLERLKSELTKQQNYFKIELKMLEDELLTRLSAAESNFLGDTLLVEKLETTKHTAAEIEMKVLEAKFNEVKINEAREHYRPVAARASLLYFIMNDLNKISPMYQFSLKAFNMVFRKAIQQADPSEDVRIRVTNLIDRVTYLTFIYISRGLFERDKLTFTAQLAFQLLIMNKEIDARELDFLLRFNIDHSYNCPLEFLSNSAWSAIKTMSFMDEFRGLDRDIEGSPKRWKKVVESECPEKEKLPQEWKTKSSLQKLIMMRALRPDRMTYAVRNFVEEKLGKKYVERRKTEFAKSFSESSPASPIVFILSPGVDPLKDVESLGNKLGFTIDLGKLHNISLGQGQEVIAEIAMEKASKEGHWVILQNIHLVAKWLSTLEKLLEKYSEESHSDYRVFMSAEPPPSPKEHIIPQGILENSIKITNEPPTGMRANLHSALDNFDQNILDQCTREQEFKTILFSLCYFHACVAERRKFGPQGWNKIYPFNFGDLTISVSVLYNYLEANAQIPWEDLRFLFGEIMYGGHITDDWDRRLCRSYLEEYLQPNQFDRKLALAPGFVIPSNLDYQGYHKYIDEMLPPESPTHYGLHPNAEIEFLTVTSDNLFRTLLELQSRESIVGEGATQTVEEKGKAVLDDILEKLPEEYNMSDITSKSAERTPYILVCFQECERMNILLNEIRRSLKELDLGLKGELAISSEMEQLQTALFFDNVPDTWMKLAYPSTYGLAQWYTDVLLRCRELDSWTQDLSLPSVVWISGFFNPQSFLTAVMQSLARKNEWPLDKMHLTVDVTKKYKEEFAQPAREGAYIYGLHMEGARWDFQSGHIAEARLKVSTPTMPVIFVRAIPNDRQDTRNIYECPVYKTKLRGSTYVWAFPLKTKERPAKWIIAGVALLLSV
ncbi:dynein axonemal heavy chain 11-like [Pleurodeles waltl]|uniref:dynein axonemal heavy chain 11-like n=1 Tax=Pleurodeles waltl TaxID=8319 RepID=UPI0037095303